MCVAYWRNMLLKIFPKPEGMVHYPQHILDNGKANPNLIVIFIMHRSNYPRSRRIECSRKGKVLRLDQNQHSTLLLT